MSVLPDTAVVEAGRLSVGGVVLSELAREHGTPLHVYDEATLRARARAYRDALGTYPGTARAVYACKANATVGLLRVVLDEGMGMDVASEGELAHALAAGAPPERIVLHGNNKSAEELRAARVAGVGRIVVDSFDELDLAGCPARRSGLVCPSPRAGHPRGGGPHPRVRAHRPGRLQVRPRRGVGRLPASDHRARDMPSVELVGALQGIGSQVFVAPTSSTRP